MAIHVGLLAAQGGGPQGGAVTVAAPPLDARIVLVVSPPDLPRSQDLPQRPVESPPPMAVKPVPARPRPDPERRHDGPTAAASAGLKSQQAIADSPWYTALELDIFPRAESGLSGATGADAGSTGKPALLLWLRIDETGRVVDVSPGAPGIAPDRIEAARALLAAARFAPGRKDERAVRSRLLVSLQPDHYAGAAAGAESSD